MEGAVLPYSIINHASPRDLLHTASDSPDWSLRWGAWEENSLLHTSRSILVHDVSTKPNRCNRLFSSCFCVSAAARPSSLWGLQQTDHPTLCARVLCPTLEPGNGTQNGRNLPGSIIYTPKSKPIHPLYGTFCTVNLLTAFDFALFLVAFYGCDFGSTYFRYQSVGTGTVTRAGRRASGTGSDPLAGSGSDGRGLVRRRTKLNSGFKSVGHDLRSTGALQESGTHCTASTLSAARAERALRVSTEALPRTPRVDGDQTARGAGSALVEGLREVTHELLAVLDPDAQPHQVVRHPALLPARSRAHSSAHVPTAQLTCPQLSSRADEHGKRGGRGRARGGRRG
eukprot:1712613-Rhodomonas_salina.1